MKKKNPAVPKARREKLALIGKIVAAVLLLPLMLATMAMVGGVKDGRQNSAYCASCHQDPYYTSWSDPNSTDLARKHAEQGVTCQACHARTMSRSLEETANYITGNYYYPFQEQKYPMATCLSCHDSYQKVISLTTTKITGKERNPHAGHWGTLECYECHKVHRDSFDYCAQCHNPVADGPGWVTKKKR
jgi:hypothetical protein